MRLFALAIAPILIVAAACGGSTDRRNPPVSRDGGSRADASQQDANTSSTADAAMPPDGGPPGPDAGDDAGQPSDGGGEDGATPEDTGPADAGFHTATLRPATLDFGRTVNGAEAVLTATISNNSQDTITVRVFPIEGTGAGLFDFTLTATGSFNLARGAQLPLQIRFRPILAGAITANIPVELCTNGCPGSIDLAGEGIDEAIGCSAVVNFGRVNPANCRDMPLSCTNGSSHPATLLGWTVAAGTHSAFTFVPGQAAPPAVLAAGSAHSLDIRYCPTEFGTHNGVIDVLVAHPVPNFQVKSVPLLGQGGGPDIQCAPLTANFGTIGAGQAAIQRVRCHNAGNVNLSITSAMLDMAAPASLTLAATTMGMTAAFPVTLAPMAYLDLDLTWAPPNPAMLATQLAVTSNDLDTPNVTIPVIGDAVNATGCIAQLGQPTLDFGTISVGTPAQLSTFVRNGGNGTCVVTIRPLMGSSAFSVLTSPVSGSIGPGQTFLVTIGFTPSAAQAYSDILSIQTTDVMRPHLTLNLAGTGANVDVVQVSPRNLDFGTVAVGCGNAAVRSFTLRNLDLMPMTVRAVMRLGGPAFTLTGTVSAMLRAGDAMTIPVTFRPAAAQTYNGLVQINVMGLSPVTVPLRGTGGTTAQNVVTFPAAAVQKVDLLLVVDDSCSMAEEQTLLQAVAPVLIQRADRAGVDYHIGVTTTDAVNNPGELRGTPTYVDRNLANRTALLQTSIVAGTNGDPTESGLHTATLAVTDPMLLMGRNTGFLRPDAELSVIELTDEEDFSLDPVGTYVAMMRNRPIGVQGTLRFSAISGGLAGCSSMNGNAQPAFRIQRAIAMTGGINGDICASNYGPIIQRISDLSFGNLRDEFQLGSQPAPGTIEVRVNGALVPTVTGTISQWFVDYENSKIVFAARRAPPRTASVEIRYTSFCISATCGNSTLQPGEQCDDGNMVNTDACPDTCFNAFCGDGFVLTAGEQCDDQNTVPGDGCNHACGVEGCGNGVTEPPEECDNGGNNSDTLPNACRTSCRSAYCGDGVVDMGEPCDDGNTRNTDACLAGCILPRCGDGFVQQGVEACDDGNTNNMDACNNSCMWTVAGFTISTTPNTPLVPTPGTGFTFTNGSADDGYQSLPIGFGFDFLGTAQTNVVISTNGFIAFSTSSATSYSNLAIPDVMPPDGFIAWWWDDLHTAVSGVVPAAQATTALTGTAPNRVRTITLLNMMRYLGGAEQLNVEIRLHETTNVIEVHYGAVTMSTSGGVVEPFGATVGWEDPTGARGADPLGCSPDCERLDWPANTIYRYTP